MQANIRATQRRCSRGARHAHGRCCLVRVPTGCAGSASHQPPKKSRPPAQMPMRSPRKISHAQVQSHLICLRIGAMRQQDLQMGHTGPRRRGCRRHARRHHPTTQPPGQSTTHTALPGHTASCTHKHTPSISRVLVVSTTQKNAWNEFQRAQGGAQGVCVVWGGSFTGRHVVADLAKH